MANVDFFNISFSYDGKNLVIYHHKKEVLKKPFATRREAMAFAMDSKNHPAITSAVAKALASASK